MTKTAIGCADHLDYDVTALRQALWDVYAALGFDTDGDRTPAAVKNLRQLVVDAAKTFRQDYDQALSEIPPVKPTMIEKMPELGKRFGITPATLLGYTPDEIRRIGGLD